MKFQSISEAVEDNGLKCLVHGLAGVGKTVLSATTGEPTLIINAEGGLLSIKRAPNYIKVKTVKSFEDINEVYDYLKDEEHGFKWVILDSISDVAEVVLSEEKKIAKDARQAYGALAEQMMNLIRKFRDLKNINVLFTAKQAKKEDQDSGVTTYLPSMPGNNLTQNISYLFDEVFALIVEEDSEGNEKRYLQTRRTFNMEAKDRSGMLAQKEKANMKHIYNKIHGIKTEPKKEPVKKEPVKTETKPTTSK